MVKEVKFSCDVRQLEPPVCRDSVLDDEPTAEKARRPAVKRRRKAEEPSPAAATKPVPAARPATERRHLAGADWLSGYLPRARKAK